MRQTWRWFGPADTIDVADLPQAGVEGIVSALHHIPPGEVWTRDEIELRQREISHPQGASTGLEWEVVESLPVSETVKTKGPDFSAHIDAYRESLRNLAACGLEVVCYNFMPILDWTRTDLAAAMHHGGNAMKFDLVDFAVFDLFILRRQAARDDFGPEILALAEARVAGMDEIQKLSLQNNVVAGLPGANDNWDIAQVRELLNTYTGISANDLRANLVDFLSEVAPLANDLGLRLCCHPDDPPFSLLGLPRIMSCESDYAQILNAVDLPSSGATFCTGSLGVAEDFDAPGFIRRLGSRIHFVHLRNTTRIAPSDGQKTSFYEAAHLEGDTDMVATIRALVAEEERRRAEGRSDWRIPMRPDHGQDILSDLKTETMPGYPLIGRTRGLAELRGVMAACQQR